MEKYWNEASIVVGVVGGVMTKLLGGMDGILHALIVFVVLDYLTGIIKAFVLKKLSSDVGFKGLVRKVLIFVVVAAAVEAEKIIGDAIPLREVVIMFYTANEGISLLENVAEFLPIPEKLKEAFQQIRGNQEEAAGADQNDQENNIQ